MVNLMSTEETRQFDSYYYYLCLKHWQNKASVTFRPYTLDPTTGLKCTLIQTSGIRLGEAWTYSYPLITDTYIICIFWMWVQGIVHMSIRLGFEWCKTKRKDTCWTSKWKALVRRVVIGVLKFDLSLQHSYYLYRWALMHVIVCNS